MKQRMAIACGVLLLAGCGKEHMGDCFKSVGKHGVEERIVPHFRIIKLTDRIDLEITQDTTVADPTVTVEGGRNILPNVVTELRDGVLYIGNDMRCNWVRDLKVRPLVRITLRSLDKLIYSGVGNVVTTTPMRGRTFRVEQWDGHGTVRLELHVDTCYIGLHTGVGDVVVTGTAQAAYLYASNFAPIEARGLMADAVHVNSSGSGDIRCRPGVRLHAQLFSLGDVYYTGDPVDLQSSVFSSGQLIRE